MTAWPSASPNCSEPNCSNRPSPHQEALGRFVAGRRLGRLRIASPFLVRSVDPPIAEVTGRRVEGFGRLDKRGRHGHSRPACQSPVQRIVYADNKATCQTTGGKLLRDRALSRLLEDDWPRTLDELEARKRI